MHVSVPESRLGLDQQSAMNGPATAIELRGAGPVNPAALARWLLASSEALAPPSRARVARLTSELVESFLDDPAQVPPDVLVEILARHGGLLSQAEVMEVAGELRGAVTDSRLDEATDAALGRAPEHAGLLRVAAESALAAGRHDRAHELLTRLVRADPSLATARWALTTRARLPDVDRTPVRIALLSSYTADSLVPFLDLECRSLGLAPGFYVAPFNTWERDVLGAGSGLERFAPQIVFLAVSADDLVPELATTTAAELADAGAAAVDRLLAAAARFTSWSSAALIVHGLHSAFRDPDTAVGGRLGPQRSEVMARLNARLADGLRALPRAYLLDIADVLTRRRSGAADNPKMRHLASMRLAADVLPDVARASARFIAPLTGRTRKCVVLDLDNTLWGGIVGEDGPHGIRLGRTSPGSEFREFQHYLQALSRRGILLAVNSKNNPDDALEVIRGHEDMVLREGAFSAIRINWDSKAANMLSLAEELSLGLDSFVFVDDSEKERALMRQALPDVLTIELPRDPALYRETLEDLPELQTLAVTEEDRGRAQQYAERRQREHLRVLADSVEGYLESLGIAATVGLATERTLSRVHQLFMRTNQFNLTTRRYEPGALAERAVDPSWRIYTVHVRDRFGDHGLVATALVRLEDESWSIDNLVMSCRVIGYGVEDALLARIAADARARSARALRGELIPSAKNAPARDFYARNGFARLDAAADSGQWQLALDFDAPRPPGWITMEAAHGA